MTFLPELAREALLAEKLGGGKVRCQACAQRCLTAPGGCGRCGVRFNEGGVLKAPWGYVSSAAPDPIEKKPFFHVLPGARTLSFGMFGCNFHCGFCQNWQIADVNPALFQEAGQSGGVKAAGGLKPLETSPAELVSEALAIGAGVVVSTYNEPLITAEWAAAVFSGAKEKKLRTAFVSNGYATPETAAFLRPVLDLWKVDLKCFSDENYRKVCGAELSKVLEGIRIILAAGFWVEVVTLVIPGFNDSDAELGAMADFLAGLSKDIPWHLTAFHPDHLMTGTPPTPQETLYRDRDIDRAAGNRYVYCGNTRGAAGQDTVCPSCGLAVIEREGFSVKNNLLGKNGA
ncbi:MAG: AmmeMemoRadiSam system radical SAM enzyme, partial [Elusimicrobiota bacterium]|nr:AmmeMemoRadiSam system radical SAM enzyme [Elusimicrobiota bacterium]